MDISKREFSEREFEAARSRLFNNIDKDRNLRDQLQSSVGIYMPHDLAETVFYNASFVRDDWPECDMTSMAANGSYWEKARLLACDLVKATVQHSEFSDCSFVDCRLEASNFANSSFFSTAFENTIVDGCSFVGAEFESSLLTGGFITDSTFELCRFRNTTIEGIRFGNVNMCYTLFDDVRFNNVELPFFQLPYTFFGLQRLEDFSDVARVAVLQEGSISAEEYFGFLPDFIVYLSHESDYFPLVNCLEMFGEHDVAIERCLEGIRAYCDERDYRMLHHMCLLATRVLKVDDDLRLRIMSIIENDQDEKTNMSRGEQFQFSKYYPRIKHVVLDNPLGETWLDISFQTDVPADDYGSLSIFVEAIEQTVANSDVQLAGKHLEVRHNSPFLVDIMMFGSPQGFIALANSLMSLYIPMTGELIAEAEAVATSFVANHGAEIANGVGFVGGTITIAQALSKVGKIIKRRFSTHSTEKEEEVETIRWHSEDDLERIARFESRRLDFARLRDCVRDIEREAAPVEQEAPVTSKAKPASKLPIESVTTSKVGGIGIVSVRVRAIDEV